MTDKLTDKEIVKALKILEKDTNCGDCVVKKQCKGDCVFTKSLDLINRLLGENKGQSIMIKLLKGSIEDYKKSYTNQKAANERLQKSYLRNQEIFAEQSLENERLKAEIERLQNILICFMDALGKVRKVDDIDEISLIPLMSELNKQYRAELKAEAYKEFAERLKKLIRTKEFSDDVAMLMCAFVENLVKEMEDENND